MIEITGPDGVTIKFPDNTPRNEITRVMRERYGAPPSGTESFARGAADMLSFGFADEIGAGVETGAGLWGDYGQELEAYRDAYEKAREANPGIYLAGQITGAVAPALVTGGTSLLPAGAATAGRVAYGAGNLARNAGLGRAALQTGAYGAGQGGLYGFGSGEGTADRLLGAGINAGTGAVTGAIAPVAGAALSKAASGAVRGAQGVGTQIAQKASGLPPTTAPQRRAANQVARNIEEAGMTVDQAIRGVGPGRPLAAQSESLSDAAGQVYRANPAVRDTMTEAAESTYQTARGDIFGEMKTSLGGADNSVKWLKGHKKQMRDAANVAYPQAFEQTANRPVPSEIVAFLERQIEMDPSIYALARQNAGRRNLVTMRKDGTFQRPPTFEDLEYFRRALDDKANTLFNREGAGGAASGVKDVADDLRQVIDNNAPEIASVRAQYSDDKSIQSAFDAGKKAFTDTGAPKDFEEVAEAFERMSDPEKAAFSKGIWARIRKGMGGRSKNSPVVIRNLFEREDGENILRMALGDQATAQLATLAGRLDDANRIGFKLKGGSPTALRQGDDKRLQMAQDAGGTLLAAGAGDVGGTTAGIVSMLKRSMANPPSDEQLEAAARILMSENPQEVRQLMNAAAAGNQSAAQSLETLIKQAVSSAAGGITRSGTQRLLAD